MKADLYDFLMFCLFKVCVGSIEELHKLSGVLLTDLHRYFTKVFTVLIVALPAYRQLLIGIYLEPNLSI